MIISISICIKKKFKQYFYSCTYFLWKMPAARAADAFVFANTSEKCSTPPAPLLAITGMLTASEINFVRPISNPFP
jgi:hypothetical protein